MNFCRQANRRLHIHKHSRYYTVHLKYKEHEHTTSNLFLHSIGAFRSTNLNCLHSVEKAKLALLAFPGAQITYIELTDTMTRLFKAEWDI